MNRARLIPLLLAAVVLSAGLLQSCAGVSVPDAEKWTYTAVNLWYKHREKIVLHRHQGTMIPVGTKVKIEGISGRAIRFTDQQGESYRLVFMRKYRAPNATTEDLFKLYFTETDPLGKNGALAKLSDRERDLVKSGKIGVGMCKEAVLMAYGYPPGHMTPSTEMNVWKYWDNKFRARLVHFQNNRISEIQQTL